MIERIIPKGISLLVRTLRFKFEGEPLPERAVVAFWHSRMIAGWWTSRKNALAMVSKSNDGDALASLLSKWDYLLARGSSNNGGLEALSDAIELVNDGKAKRLVMTPDGSRGPREVFKRGIFIASIELDIPLFFLEITYSSKITLNRSWDRFQIPLPYSTVLIKTYQLSVKDFTNDREEQTVFLQEISKVFAQC